MTATGPAIWTARSSRQTESRPPDIMTTTGRPRARRPSAAIDRSTWSGPATTCSGVAGLAPIRSATSRCDGRPRFPNFTPFEPVAPTSAQSTVTVAPMAPASHPDRAGVFINSAAGSQLEPRRPRALRSAPSAVGARHSEAAAPRKRTRRTVLISSAPPAVRARSGLLPYVMRRSTPDCRACQWRLSVIAAKATDPASRIA